MNAQDLPEIPSGPADVDYPRRALSRLALSSAAADTAETAIGHVPTIADGNAYEVVEYAARLLSSARYVLTLAVVHAREIGGAWSDIAEALSVSEQDAEERYRGDIAWWEDALDRPWERSGAYLVSRMPSGCTDPAWTADYLDGWCAQHIPQGDASRSLAQRDGVEDRMVSANLPKHSTLTEWNSVWRTGTYLAKRNVMSGPEWDVYQARKADVIARTEAERRGRGD